MDISTPVGTRHRLCTSSAVATNHTAKQGRTPWWKILGICEVTLIFLSMAGHANGIVTEGEVKISKSEQEEKMKEEKLKCYASIHNQTKFPTNGSHCLKVWDGAMCWPETIAGATAVQPCPNYINKAILHHNATRTCQKDGRWYVHPETNETWTNLTRCFGASPNLSELFPAHMGRLRLMYNIGYGISLVSLLIAVLIMVCFKKLHCPRNTIHLNLFASFILRASFSFLKENLLVEGLGFPSDVIEINGVIDLKPNSSHWECKLFFSSFHYLLGANYMWIFIEALYLHMLLSVAVFSERSGIKYYMLFGWAAPLTFVIPWAVVRATKEDVLCWNTNPTEAYFWITHAPIVVSIVINFILFLNILRVLFTKLSAVNSPEAKKFRYRKLAKSTLVLIPLFGVHYIVFLGLPKHVNALAELVKLYFEMFFNSIQGFFVALLFCFLNGEVQGEVCKRWQRFRLTHQSHLLTSYRSGNTMMSYVSRARDSIGSLHLHEQRSKPNGRSKFQTMDETPMNSIVSDAPERQPLANGKTDHEHLENQQLNCNGSADYQVIVPDGCFSENYMNLTTISFHCKNSP